MLAVSMPRPRTCSSCSKFTLGYRPGFLRSVAESEAGPSGLAPVLGGAGGGPPAVRYGIYTLARVLWRLDSLVSRHMCVTQNS